MEFCCTRCTRARFATPRSLPPGSLALTGFNRGAKVERSRLAREIGPEIDGRDRVSIGHGFSVTPGFQRLLGQNRVFQRVEQRPRAAAMPVYREGLLAALPLDCKLTRRKALSWQLLRKETILVQGWEDSQAEREFLTSLIGGVADFTDHAASRQDLLALVGAGFGVAIVTQSEAAATLPGIDFRPIDEPNAVLLQDLPEAEEPALGRFIAFIRDAARSRGLFCGSFRPPQLAGDDVYTGGVNRHGR